MWFFTEFFKFSVLIFYWNTSIKCVSFFLNYVWHYIFIYTIYLYYTSTIFKYCVSHFCNYSFFSKKISFNYEECACHHDIVDISELWIIIWMIYIFFYLQSMLITICSLFFFCSLSFLPTSNVLWYRDRGSIFRWVCSEFFSLAYKLCRKVIVSSAIIIIHVKRSVRLILLTLLSANLTFRRKWY